MANHQASARERCAAAFYFEMRCHSAPGWPGGGGGVPSPFWLFNTF